MDERPPRWVSYDRWQAEHSRLLDELARLSERVKDLEEADELHRNRLWTLSLALVTALAAPLIVAAVVAWATAKGIH